MNETLAHIASGVKKQLDKGGLGEFTVSARTAGGSTGLSWRDSTQPEKFDVSLIIQNEGAETDPAKYKKFIVDQLESATALTPYIEFKEAIPEPEKDLLEALAVKTDALYDKAAAAGVIIPKVAVDWIRNREELAKLRETSNDVREPREHAIRTQRIDDVNIKSSLDLPSGVDADEVKKSLARPDLKSLLARMTAKRLSKDPGEQALIIQKVLALDVIPTVQNYGYGSSIDIEFRSKELTEALKKPGGIAALSEKELEDLKSSNPLLLLKNGDGLTPETPDDLSKTVARAILFEGEKGERPIKEFAKIAGPKDVKALMKRTDRFIQKNLPELAEESAALLKDKLFEDHYYWGGPSKNEDGTPRKDPVRITKQENPNYVEGQFRVDLSIPAEKLPEVLNQLAELDGPDAEKGWAAKFAKDAEKKLAANDAPPASALDRLANKEPAAVGAAR